MRMTRNYNRTIKAWGLLGEFDWGPALLGRGCWQPVLEADPPRVPRLFRTRSLAREAKKTCCYQATKVVKAKINVKVVPVDSGKEGEIGPLAEGAIDQSRDKARAEPPPKPATAEMLKDMAGTWPGEPDDGFEESIDEHRHPERILKGGKK